MLMTTQRLPAYLSFLAWPEDPDRTSHIMCGPPRAGTAPRTASMTASVAVGEVVAAEGAGNRGVAPAWVWCPGELVPGVPPEESAGCCALCLSVLALNVVVLF